MRLSRIHVEAELKTGQSLQLPQAKAHYVKNVLRIKNGQQLILFNGKELIDHLAIIDIDGKRITASLQSTIEKNNESSINTHVLQAIGRSEHIDYVVQKATELGVNKITLFNSERTQAPLRATRLEKKLEHWKAIAISACEQCNRNHIPVIFFSRSIDDVLHMDKTANGILLDFQGKKINLLVKHLEHSNPVNILIGPEGGLNANEIDRAKKAGFISCRLGPRVLRMETAASSALTLLQHYLGDI